MRKRITGFLVALFAAVLFVAPTTALAAWPTTGTLWVDGQDLMADDDHTITCSDGGTAQYDPDTLTLTLTDAQITRLDDQGKGIDAPYANAGLTIVLKGESKTGPIQARSLTFEGDGSLDVSGTSSPVCWTPEDLAVNGGTVTITGNVQVQGNLTVSAGTLDVDNNLKVTGSIDVTDGATLDVAVANNHAVECDGPVTVRDATFLASSENYMGVYVTAGDFTATNSTVDLSGSSYALYAAGNTSFTGGSTTLATSSGTGYAFYAVKGISFDGGDAGSRVTIDTPGAYGSYTGGMLVSKGDVTFDVTALHGLTAAGNVELTGAKGTITAENAAIFSDTADVVLSACDLGLSGEMTLNSSEGDITIEGSDLTVSGTDAVYAKGDLLIDGSQLDVTATLRPIATGSGDLTIQGDETHIDATGTRFLGTGGLFTMTGGTLDVDIALAEGESLAAGIYGNDGISISGGTVHAKATGAEGASAYGAVSNGEISVTGGIVTFEGSTAALYASKSGGSVSTGDDAWYQWATAPADASTPASETSYTYGTGSETYLRLEPVGTTYVLAVEGGEGGGPYAAGTKVSVSAPAYDASDHFAGWAVTDDPTGAGTLADAGSAETTFTMPAGDVTLTASFEPHSLIHHDAKVPTCTEAGWEAYDECACGYSTYKEIPAAGHDFVDGVCSACGAEDPDYVASEKPKPAGEEKPKPAGEEKSAPAIPATGDVNTFFSAVPALVGATAVAVGTVLRRRR